MITNDSKIITINFLLCILQIIWFSHFIQVLVPETGFDAIWYHLPVLKSILENGKIVFSDDLYQSLNPLFTDLFFLIGYYYFGSLGTKIIAYIFSLLLIFTSFKLSKVFLSTRVSLSVVILISTFQVISWQAASFYVDVAKAFWEVLAIYFLVKNIDNQKIVEKIASVLSFSASLGTKLFSILLFPTYVYIFIKNLIQTKQLKLWPIILLALSIPMFFYVNAFLVTGNPFYSFSIHMEKLAEIGGQSNLFYYLFSRMILIFFSPIKLIFARDYVTPLMVVLLVPLFINMKKIIKDNKLSILFIFSGSQWMIWWLVPPLSTRYAISGFITLLILEVVVIKRYFQKINKNQMIFILLLFSAINFLPRIFVNYRSLKYILSNQTTKEYIQQFYDGSIDSKLKSWYKF